jgi:hypothetical protein
MARVALIPDDEHTGAFSVVAAWDTGKKRRKKPVYEEARVAALDPLAASLHMAKLLAERLETEALKGRD